MSQYYSGGTYQYQRPYHTIHLWATVLIQQPLQRSHRQVRVIRATRLTPTTDNHLRSAYETRYFIPRPEVNYGSSAAMQYVSYQSSCAPFTSTPQQLSPSQRSREAAVRHHFAPTLVQSESWFWWNAQPGHQFS
jgi:hypothetical protein